MERMENNIIETDFDKMYEENPHATLTGLWELFRQKQVK